MLVHDGVYGSDGPCISWDGRHVTDEAAFIDYLRGAVRERLHDAAARGRFVADMRELATTEMATDTLTALLDTEPEREPWEVGEAIAECVLADAGAVWPSHTDRDKRTPKASLPGADLVGFMGAGANSRLVLGEVKTSSEERTPPGTMTGRSGMIHQLDGLASRMDIHLCLLKWLHGRCVGTSYWDTYQHATRRYLASKGRDIVLFGILMRDTVPAELDLKNRAEALAGGLALPTTLSLTAWYLPRPAQDWPVLVGGPV